MNPCKKKEPRVINNVLIQTCIYEQCGKGEAGRLAREEGVPFNEVEHLRLEYLNILRIDHLWMLSNLTKLSLSQNYIEKIENLEELVNLKELNLSFNKIDQIENLDKLVNLEILSLFENRVSRIENMDMLKKLTIFSIGRNSIESTDDVIYLRRFNNLMSVNLAGNPCTEKEDFRIFIAAFLPQITYYEYKMLTEEEREIGCDFYRRQLDKMEEEEAKEHEIRDKIEAEIAEAELHAESFVEYLGTSHLFNSLFTDDEDGQSLLIMGDEAKEVYTEFENQFTEVCQQLFQFGQEQYHVRKTDVTQFFQCIENGKLETQQKSIEHMEEFLQRKAEIFYDVKKLQEDLENNEIKMAEYNTKIETVSTDYNNVIHESWKTLMGYEMCLYEQIDDTAQTFEHTIAEMVNVFMENAQGHFTQMRDLQGVYNDTISEIASRYLTTSNVQPDFEMPEELKGIMGDKETLNNAIGASHDLHLQLIDNREDLMMNKAKGWLENLIQDLQKSEIERNRAKVLEINHFLDIQREEFEELLGQSGLFNPNVDAVFT